MAATVTVNVDVKDAQALVQLETLDQKIDALNKKSININVNTNGTEGGLGGAADDAEDLGKNVQTANTGLSNTWKWVKRIAVGAAVSFGVKSVKEALDTMKDVDSELANIRKVTGQSAEAIEELGNRAYDAASRYGVSAKDFLSNAADFAKAGYDNYEQLSELAIETQLVGDVSAEMASKFLIAADAAYKFGGNTKKLHSLLDEANEIENNFATSIYKIAQGFPIVANTAAMANMSVEELMAALGTITAKTQQTGSKAATALRALIMNINHEVGAWIDDGEEKIQVTEESVKSLTEALSKYGNEAVQAALATGKIVDPIEAIRSLATAWQNGDLTQRELGGILEKLGGKLRADQLTALIENFDTFENMLDMVGTSAGSADKELDVMLGTWEAKINQLSNTWTEFVSHLADTSAIKSAIEGLTSVIDGLDQAMLRLSQNQFERAESDQKKIEKSYEDLFGIGGEYRDELDALRANADKLNEFDSKRLQYLTEQEAAMRKQVTDAKELTKAQKVSYLNETMYGDMVYENGEFAYQEEFTRAYAQLQAFQKDFNEAVVDDGSKNKRQISEALNGMLSEYSEFYGLIKDLRDEGVDVGEDAEAFAKAYESAMTRARQATREASEEAERFGELSLKDRFDYYNNGGLELQEHAEMEAEEAAETIEPVEVPVPIEFVYEEGGPQNIEILKKVQAFTEQASEDAQFQIRIDNVSETENKIQGVTDALESVPGVKNIKLEDNAITCEANVDSLNEAIANLPNGKEITISIVTTGSLPNITPHASGTKNAPGGMALVNERGPELISDNGRAYIANGGKPAIVNLGKGAIVLTAEETKQALGNTTLNQGIGAYASGLFNQTTSGKTSPILINLPTGGTFNLGNTRDGLLSITSLPKKTPDSHGTGGGNKGGSGSGKSSESSESTSPTINWEDKEKVLKEELDALDELAEWYHNQKKHTEEGNTYADAIKKVDALRSEYLKAGFAETSKEVTTLANKIFDYEKDIAEAKAHAIDDLEDELDNLKSQIELAENQGDLNRMLELQNEAQKKVAQLIEAYRAAGFSDTSPEILKLANMGYDYASDSGSTMKDLWKNLIDAIEDMRDTQDDANELAEKQLAVDEAREALTNAQNQRTVRIFNPVTGQWEWVSDAKSVQQAQESLTKAEDALLKEQQSQEMAALKKIMENGGSLSDVSIGPGLTALLSGASLEQTNAFASALGLLSGGLATTADTSSRSIFDSVDSHDNVTQYTFNGVTIDAATAENTTLAELTQLITPLALTTNMPA